MTSQEKKKYLRQYRNIDKRLEALKEKRAAIYDQATKTTPNYADSPRSGGGNKIQAAIERLDEMDKKLGEEYLRLTAQKCDIEMAISAMPDLLEKIVLQYAYTNKPEPLSLVQISHKLNYSLDHINRAHGMALKHIQLKGRLR